MIGATGGETLDQHGIRWPWYLWMRFLGKPRLPAIQPQLRRAQHLSQHLLRLVITVLCVKVFIVGQTAAFVGCNQTWLFWSGPLCRRLCR